MHFLIGKTEALVQITLTSNSRHIGVNITKNRLFLLESYIIVRLGKVQWKTVLKDVIFYLSPAC